MGYPLIYCNITKTEWPFWKTVHKQATDLNDNVFVITDKTMEIKTHNYKDFNRTAERIKDNYVHRGKNPREFEMKCILRWAIILDFVKAQGIKKFCVSDWDVLLFCNIQEESKRFSDYDFTYQNGRSIGFSFWNNIEALEYLVNMMIDAFCNKNSDLSIEFIKGCGDINDMGFAHKLINSGKFKCIDTYRELINDTCFDNNMVIADRWGVTDYKIKDIKFRDGKAYCYHIFKEKDIEMKCLHFTNWARNTIFDHVDRYHKSLKE